VVAVQTHATPWLAWWTSAAPVADRPGRVYGRGPGGAGGPADGRGHL